MPVPYNLENVVVELDNGWYYEDPLDPDTMQGPYADVEQCVRHYKMDARASYF